MSCSRRVFGPGQQGTSGFVSLLIVLAVLVGGFVGYKFLQAYRDINGMEGDLSKVSRDLCIECIGDKRAERNRLIPQIEEVKKTHGRTVEFDYSTLDYATASNVMYVKGSRIVDLEVTKFTWKFTLEVDLLK